jgi:hypothetical protein
MKLLSNNKVDHTVNILIDDMKKHSPNLTIVFNIVEFNCGEIYIAGQYCPYLDGFPYIVINSLKDSKEYIKRISTLLHEFGHHQSVIDHKPVFTQSKSGFIYGNLENNTVRKIFTEELFAWLFGIYFLLSSSLSVGYKLLTLFSCVKYMLGHYSILVEQYYKCLMYKENFAENYHYKRFI